MPAQQPRGCCGTPAAVAEGSGLWAGSCVASESLEPVSGPLSAGWAAGAPEGTRCPDLGEKTWSPPSFFFWSFVQSLTECWLCGSGTRGDHTGKKVNGGQAWKHARVAVCRPFSRLLCWGQGSRGEWGRSLGVEGRAGCGEGGGHAGSWKMRLAAREWLTQRHRRGREGLSGQCWGSEGSPAGPAVGFRPGSSGREAGCCFLCCAWPGSTPVTSSSVFCP